MRRKELVTRLGVYKNVLTPSDIRVLGREVIEKLPSARGKFPYAVVVRLVLGKDSEDRTVRKYVSYLHKVIRGCIDPEKIRSEDNLRFLRKVLEVVNDYEPEYAEYLRRYIKRAERYNPWIAER